MYATSTRSASDATPNKAKDFRIAARDWLTQIMAARNVSQRVKIVAWVLYDKFNRMQFDECGELVAFPTLRTIDKESGMSKRTVQAAIKELAELGYIVVRRGRGVRGLDAINRYVAARPSPAESAPKGASTAAKPGVANVIPLKVDPTTDGASPPRRALDDASTNPPRIAASWIPGVPTRGIPGSPAEGYPGNPDLLSDRVTDRVIRRAPRAEPIDKRSARAAMFDAAEAYYGPTARAVIAKAESAGVDPDEIVSILRECIKNDYPLGELAYQTWRPN